MFNSITKLLFLSVVSSALFLSCKKEKCEEIIPSITYKSYEQYGKDSLRLIIGFHDCDGDIGLQSHDTVAPFNIGSDYYYNILTEYYEYENGIWERFEFTGGLNLHGRLPYLVPYAEGGKLEGEIYYTLHYPYYRLPNDTVKFSLQIIDRAHHKSNIIETEPLLTPSN